MDDILILVVGTRDNCKMGKLMFVFLSKYHSVVDIKKNETGRTGGMCGREEKCLQGVSLSGTFRCDI